MATRGGGTIRCYSRGGSARRGTPRVAQCTNFRSLARDTAKGEEARRGEERREEKTERQKKKRSTARCRARARNSPASFRDPGTTWGRGARSATTVAESRGREIGLSRARASERASSPRNVASHSRPRTSNRKMVANGRGGKPRPEFFPGRRVSSRISAISSV